jgi:hypothetical protein
MRQKAKGKRQKAKGKTLTLKTLENVFAERPKAEGLAPKAAIAARMHKKLIRQINGIRKSQVAHRPICPLR